MVDEPIEMPVEPKRPKVLFAKAHEGFYRNFEQVVSGLLEAGVDVHVHFSKSHHVISMDDYRLPSSTAGRLTVSTSQSVRVETDPAVERLRIVRDLVHYSRPWYESATSLRERFFHLQKRHVSLQTMHALARVLRFTPELVKDAADAMLQRHDERTPPHATSTNLLDQVEPDCIVVTPLVHFASTQVDLVKAGRQRGIPTMLAVASWDNLTNKGRLKVQPDRVAVWNQAMAREAEAFHRVPADRIRITGAPVFDSWFDCSSARTRHGFLVSLGLDPTRPLLVYTCSSSSIAGPAEHVLIKKWLAAVRTSPASSMRHANVLIRPHPMNRASWREVTRIDAHGHSRWKRAVVWPLQPKHPTDPASRAGFFDTLFHADAIVGLNTSAMLEALILGRPVLTFLGHECAVSQTRNLHFQHLAESGCVYQADTLHEHIAQLTEVLEHPPAVAEACERFVAEFLRPLGRSASASAALVDVILAEMNVAPGERVETPEPVLAGGREA